MKRKLIMMKLTASMVICAMTVTSCITATSGIKAYAASTSNELSQRETKNANLSMKAATEGMVLLQNQNNVLPIASKGDIALFGGGAYNTVKGGTGSGDVNQRYKVSIWEAFEKAGYNITSSDWLENYKETYDKGKEVYDKDPKRTWFDPPFNLTDYKLKDSDIAAASGTDTAIYVISRNSGEGADRTNSKGDYNLTDEEYSNIKKMAESFKNSIVLLNVGGVIDTKFIKDIPQLDSVLLISQGGMEGGTAAVKVVSGEVTPSGKLTDTWASNYGDYPSSETFSENDGNSLQEDYTDDIYVGYRYFDTFNIKPAYEFGYGLSYTTFDSEVQSVTADKNKVTVKVKVTNTGSKYSGKEVSQVYFSAPNGKLEKPYQELAGYGKTDLLAPGESQTLTISYKTTEMSSYSEDDAAYLMEKGNYIIRVGNSSRNTHVGAVLTLDSTVTTEQLSNQMKIDNKITTLSNKGIIPYSNKEDAKEISKALKISLSSEELNLIDGNNASKYDNEDVTTYISNAINDTTTTNASASVSYKENTQKVDVKENAKLYDVYNKEITMEEFVAGLSNEKLADIVEGIGFAGSSAPIVGAQSNSVKGAAGETTGNYYDSDGIPNIVLADGPAGIRITQSYENNDQTYYQYCTAWPIGTLLAQTWDTKVMKEVGVAIGAEMIEYGATLWLAPGMNIHRNPLCGRNFEYFSEDPFLTGTVAIQETIGVQSHPGIGVTIKHYAVNNQEKNRDKENNTVSERALREIYLKGFEMAVKGAQPMAIMTSYNLINSVPAGDDYDLCTDLTRGEWGFNGLIMTDWGGGQSTPSISMHAGNDLIMPGGSQKNIIMALVDYAPVFGDDGYVTTKKEQQGWTSVNKEQWNDFEPSTNGKVKVTTQVAAGVTFNNKAIKMIEGGIANITNEAGKRLEITTGAAVAFEEITNITYNGEYAKNTILLGDLQKSAMNVLNIIMQSTQFEKMNSELGVTSKPYTGEYSNLMNYLTLTKDDTTTNSSSSNHHNSSSSSSKDSNSNDSKVDDKIEKQWKKNEDGTWSFINSNGERAIGWVKDGGIWYHINPSGIMETGWIKDIDGSWYCLNYDGAMKTGWIKDTDGLWYYLNDNGVMRTGWFKDTNGKWYYLNDNGSMKTGWFKDTNGKWYYLNSLGDMAVDTTIDGYKVDSTGVWIS